MSIQGQGPHKDYNIKLKEDEIVVKLPWEKKSIFGKDERKKVIIGSEGDITVRTIAQNRFSRLADFLVKKVSFGFWKNKGFQEKSLKNHTAVETILPKLSSDLKERVVQMQCINLSRSLSRLQNEVDNFRFKENKNNSDEAQKLAQDISKYGTEVFNFILNQEINLTEEIEREAKSEKIQLEKEPEKEEGKISKKEDFSPTEIYNKLLDFKKRFEDLKVKALQDKSHESFKSPAKKDDGAGTAVEAEEKSILQTEKEEPADEQLQKVLEAPLSTPPDFKEEVSISNKEEIDMREAGIFNAISDNAPIEEKASNLKNTALEEGFEEAKGLKEDRIFSEKDVEKVTDTFSDASELNEDVRKARILEPLRDSSSEVEQETNSDFDIDVKDSGLDTAQILSEEAVREEAATNEGLSEEVVSDLKETSKDILNFWETNTELINKYLENKEFLSIAAKLLEQNSLLEELTEKAEKNGLDSIAKEEINKAKNLLSDATLKLVDLENPQVKESEISSETPNILSLKGSRKVPPQLKVPPQPAEKIEVEPQLVAGEAVSESKNEQMLQLKEEIIRDFEEASTKQSEVLRNFMEFTINNGLGVLTGELREAQGRNHELIDQIKENPLAHEEKDVREARKKIIGLETEKFEEQFKQIRQLINEEKGKAENLSSLISSSFQLTPEEKDGFDQQMKELTGAKTLDNATTIEDFSQRIEFLDQIEAQVKLTESKIQLKEKLEDGKKRFESSLEGIEQGDIKEILRVRDAERAKLIAKINGADENELKSLEEAIKKDNEVDAKLPELVSWVSDKGEIDDSIEHSKLDSFDKAFLKKELSTLRKTIVEDYKNFSMFEAAVKIQKEAEKGIWEGLQSDQSFSELQQKHLKEYEKQSPDLKGKKLVKSPEGISALADFTIATCFEALNKEQSERIITSFKKEFDGFKGPETLKNAFSDLVIKKLEDNRSDDLSQLQKPSNELVKALNEGTEAYNELEKQKKLVDEHVAVLQEEDAKIAGEYERQINQELASLDGRKLSSLKDVKAYEEDVKEVTDKLKMLQIGYTSLNSSQAIVKNQIADFEKVADEYRSILGKHTDPLSESDQEALKDIIVAAEARVKELSNAFTVQDWMDQNEIRKPIEQLQPEELVAYQEAVQKKINDEAKLLEQETGLKTLESKWRELQGTVEKAKERAEQWKSLANNPQFVKANQLEETAEQALNLKVGDGVDKDVVSVTIGDEIKEFSNRVTKEAETIENLMNENAEMDLLEQIDELGADSPEAQKLREEYLAETHAELQEYKKQLVSVKETIDSLEIKFLKEKFEQLGQDIDGLKQTEDGQGTEALRDYRESLEDAVQQKIQEFKTDNQVDSIHAHFQSYEEIHNKALKLVEEKRQEGQFALAYELEQKAKSLENDVDKLLAESRNMKGLDSVLVANTKALEKFYAQMEKTEEMTSEDQLLRLQKLKVDPFHPDYVEADKKIRGRLDTAPIIQKYNEELDNYEKLLETAPQMIKDQEWFKKHTATVGKIHQSLLEAGNTFESRGFLKTTKKSTKELSLYELKEHRARVLELVAEYKKSKEFLTLKTELSAFNAGFQPIRNVIEKLQSSRVASEAQLAETIQKDLDFHTSLTPKNASNLEETTNFLKKATGKIAPELMKKTVALIEQKAPGRARELKEDLKFEEPDLGQLYAEQPFEDASRKLNESITQLREAGYTSIAVKMNQKLTNIRDRAVGAKDEKSIEVEKEKLKKLESRLHSLQACQGMIKAFKEEVEDYKVMVNSCREENVAAENADLLPLEGAVKNAETVFKNASTRFDKKSVAELTLKEVPAYKNWVTKQIDRGTKELKETHLAAFFESVDDFEEAKELANKKIEELRNAEDYAQFAPAKKLAETLKAVDKALSVIPERSSKMTSATLKTYAQKLDNAKKVIDDAVSSVEEMARIEQLRELDPLSEEAQELFAGYENKIGMQLFNYENQLNDLQKKIEKSSELLHPDSKLQLELQEKLEKGKERLMNLRQERSEIKSVDDLEEYWKEVKIVTTQNTPMQFAEANHLNQVLDMAEKLDKEIERSYKRVRSEKEMHEYVTAFKLGQTIDILAESIKTERARINSAQDVEKHIKSMQSALDEIKAKRREVKNTPEISFIDQILELEKVKDNDDYDFRNLKSLFKEKTEETINRLNDASEALGKINFEEKTIREFVALESKLKNELNAVLKEGEVSVDLLKKHQKALKDSLNSSEKLLSNYEIIRVLEKEIIKHSNLSRELNERLNLLGGDGIEELEKIEKETAKKMTSIKDALVLYKKHNARLEKLNLNFSEEKIFNELEKLSLINPENISLKDILAASRYKGIIIQRMQRELHEVLEMTKEELSKLNVEDRRKELAQKSPIEDIREKIKEVENASNQRVSREYPWNVEELKKLRELKTSIADFIREKLNGMADPVIEES